MAFLTSQKLLLKIKLFFWSYLILFRSLFELISTINILDDNIPVSAIFTDDVHIEKMERGCHVVMGRRLRYVRHLPSPIDGLV